MARMTYLSRYAGFSTSQLALARVSESNWRSAYFGTVTTMSGLGGSRSVTSVVFLAWTVKRLTQSEKSPFAYARTSYWPVR